MGRFGRKSGFLTAAVALAALAWAMLAPARGQAQKPEPTQETPAFTSDVSLVRLLVSVRDAQGALIGSLGKDDFTVYDTGVRQQVAVFEHHTEFPLSISVLIDTSSSTARDLDYELNSVNKFLQALLSEGNPEDAVALYSFNDQPTLLTSFTRRQERLDEGLRGIHASGGTSMYDAIYLAASPLENRDGRHVLVVVTDGGDTTSSQGYADALKSVRLAEASLYGILVVPIAGDPGRNLGGERALDGLTADTGGRVFTPSIKQLDAAFADILRDLRTQYMLGYYPRGLPTEPPDFRPVKVELKRKDLRATTRAGYYGDTTVR